MSNGKLASGVGQTHFGNFRTSAEAAPKIELTIAHRVLAIVALSNRDRK